MKKVKPTKPTTPYFAMPGSTLAKIHWIAVAIILRLKALSVKSNLKMYRQTGRKIAKLLQRRSLSAHSLMLCGCAKRTLNM